MGGRASMRTLLNGRDSEGGVSLRLGGARKGAVTERLAANPSARWVAAKGRDWCGCVRRGEETPGSVGGKSVSKAEAVNGPCWVGRGEGWGEAAWSWEDVLE